MLGIKQIAQKMGVDKAIAYSSGARVVQGFTGVGSIFFISTFLTGVEQGFFFTFGSILALQVFFELGLTGIMTQYVAHEVSHLTFDENKEYHGEDRYKSRLASLVHFCVKWYAIIAIMIFIFLNAVGYVYFNKFGDNQGEVVEWQTPWILISIATAIQLFVSPLTSILSGLGFVKQTSKITFFQQLITPLCIWTGLVCGFKLYVTGIGYLVNVSIWFALTKKQGLQQILKNLWNYTITERVAYTEEIFHYQWKIALSWVSGYFIFQLFNPILFATEGAVVAGQMGMTLQALNAINAFSMSWLNTKVPTYSKLIALKDYANLDTLFVKTLKQMSTVCISMLLMFFVFINILRISDFHIGDSYIGNRFLSNLPLLLMSATIFANQFVNSWAAYLRCHKQEPFLYLSIIMGITCCASTVIGGRLFGLYGVVIGYTSLTCFLAVPWAHHLFVIKKKQWHEK